MSETSSQSEPTAAGLPAHPGQRVHVAWVLDGDALGRLGRILQPLAIALMDELVDVTVFCPADAKTKELPGPPVEIVRHAALKWLGFSTGASRAMAEEIRSRKIALLHAVGVETFALTRKLADSTGIPLVVSSYAAGDSRKLGMLGTNVRAVIASSDPIRRELLERHVAPAKKIHLVRPGVYLVSGETCFTRADRSVAIVAGGDLDDCAAFEAVVRSFAELQERNYDCRYFIIGNGRAERHLRKLAEELDVLGALSFVDHQEGKQLVGILKAADIYVSPAPQKRLDMPSLLAMAAGDPVVAAEGGFDDFVLPGKTALQFARGDSADLTSRLVSLLEDRPAAQALAGVALEHLHANHSLAKMVSDITAIYRQAIG